MFDKTIANSPTIFLLIGTGHRRSTRRIQNMPGLSTSATATRTTPSSPHGFVPELSAD